MFLIWYLKTVTAHEGRGMGVTSRYEGEQCGENETKRVTDLEKVSLEICCGWFTLKVPESWFRSSLDLI